MGVARGMDSWVWNIWGTGGYGRRKGNGGSWGNCNGGTPGMSWTGSGGGGGDVGGTGSV